MPTMLWGGKRADQFKPWATVCVNNDTGKIIVVYGHYFLRFNAEADADTLNLYTPGPRSVEWIVVKRSLYNL